MTLKPYKIQLNYRPCSRCAEVSDCRIGADDKPVCFICATDADFEAVRKRIAKSTHVEIDMSGRNKMTLKIEHYYNDAKPCSMIYVEDTGEIIEVLYHENVPEDLDIEDWVEDVLEEHENK